MPAIDSRATITCNLGQVISGGVSDSYLQNSGLVFTRGQITLAGIVTPQIGSAVTISYQMASGSNGTIPRSLVVLSAFADPFKETTEVSLGCLLTYLDGVMPVPSLENGDASYIGPRRLECLNGLSKSAFVPPIFANDLFKYCRDKLGLSGTANLDGTYMMDKYDLSGGYIQAIGNLLLSEGKCGYVGVSGQLEVIDLGRTPGSGRGLSVADIIDVSGVNNGEQPASVVIVPYIDKKLQRYQPDEAKWEEAESLGGPESVTIRYDGGSVTVTHTPYTYTKTYYGDPVNLTDQCELKDGGFGDLSNTVVRTDTKRSTCLGHAAGGYATQMYNAGKNPNPTLEGYVWEISTYEFDDKDRPKRRQTDIYEPFFVYAGRMSLPWVIDGAGVYMGNENILVERRIEEMEYAGEANIPEGFKPGVDMPEPVVYQRTKRQTYTAWGKTQGGSQGPAESTTLAAFKDVSQVITFVWASTGLVLTDSEVTANKAFNPKGQRRPSEADRAVEQGTLDEQGRNTKFAEISFNGQATRGRVVQYSPPHLTESYFTSSGTPVNVDSYAVSARFGRIQHKLAAGNRLGMNITTTPNKLDMAPYGSIIVNASGYSATYAANSINWSFSRDGIVASVDALFIGGNGVNGSGRKVTKKLRSELGPCWFYLPDGYDPNSLPPASDGQLIPPFNERVNVVAGIALGSRVQAQLATTLEDKTIEVGVALGVNGNQLYKEVVEVGAFVGVEATSTLATQAEVAIGVAVGTNNIVAFSAVQTVEIGVEAGVNVGPPPIVPALLMHFDDAPDFADNVWTDSSANNVSITNTAEGANSTVCFKNSDFGASRFGEGYAGFYSGLITDSVSDRGGLMSERTSALALGDEWTIEFWIWMYASDMPDAGTPQGPWTILCMDGGDWDAPIELEIVFDQATGVPSLRANIYVPPASLEQINGGSFVVEDWNHIAIVKTNDGVYLFQNGQRTNGFSGENVEVLAVDRVVVGGYVNADDTTIRTQHGIFEFDEFRIVSDRAVYDINSSTIEVPTGPFAP
jgi:hypothetical protein